jgi:uncharacterized protein (DUF1778 family)
MAHATHKSKKNNNKPKLNLSVREEQRNKLEQMASLENRSLSNLIEVMADERWQWLAEQQGIAYAETVAEAMNLKLDMDNPADCEKLRRAVLDLVAGRKMPKQKGASLSRWLLFSSLDESPTQRSREHDFSGLIFEAFRITDIENALPVTVTRGFWLSFSFLAELVWKGNRVWSLQPFRARSRGEVAG